MEDDAYESWLRVRADGAAIVTGEFEILENNTLREIPMTLSKPVSECLRGNDVLPPSLTSLDDTAKPRFVVLNISDEPMKLGMCQDITSRGCYPDTSVIPAKMSAVFPLDVHKKYFAVRMTEGCSAFLSAAQSYSTGTSRTFQSDTSISFGKSVEK
jgi:hypothetical protein